MTFSASNARVVARVVTRMVTGHVRELDGDLPVIFGYRRRQPRHWRVHVNSFGQRRTTHGGHSMSPKKQREACADANYKNARTAECEEQREQQKLFILIHGIYVTQGCLL